jgi:hypothetical protein
MGRRGELCDTKTYYLRYYPIRYGLWSASSQGMENTKALSILKQWVIKDSAGRSHPVTLMQSDHPHASLVARKPKPGNWESVPAGTVVPPVTKPKPDKQPTVIPESTLGLTWEYRASVRTKRK